MPSTTLRQSLADGRRRLEAAGIPDAALEAELLLRHALYQLPDAAVGSQHAGTPQPVAPLIDRAYLFSHLEDALEPHSASLYESLITRRLSREPTAYILGYREFYGLDFLVTPDTLIPRPETELVVQTAIDLASQRRPYPPSPRRERGQGGEVTIADIGTGCGAIAVALARAVPRAVIYATDVSAGAIEVARTNAKRHDVANRIAFRRGDLLEPVPVYLDLIVANLPYVDSEDLKGLEPEVRDHEPRLALAGGADGLDLIRRLLRQAPHYLRPRGAIIFEFGRGQAEALEAAAREAVPDAVIDVRSDLAGLPRVLLARV